MPRTFNGTSDNLRASIGAFSSATAFGTMACIYKINSAKLQGLLGTYTSAGAVTWALELDAAGVMQGGNDSGASNGPTVSVADGWCIIAYGKASGTVAPRYHKYVLSTGVWTHSSGASTLANGTTTPGASGGWRFGQWQTVDFAAGTMAAAAAWTGRTLSDVEVETLAGGLTAWLSLAPGGMWVFDQHATTQAVVDLTGNGANQTTVTGTTVSLDGVPGFSHGHPVLKVTRQAPAIAGFQGWGVPL
ncbi:hypothetical protein AB0395_35045 [Streptosporangium sp. NPDC051023]|uniref:hypothetical protein n=1 Tax=Streptosporangium sp. NPDC051023 TaxID=3155410 RepID=UPI00344D0584